MAITAQDIQDAMKRVAAGFRTNGDYLTELDQAVGDGDLGITTSKIADALDSYADQTAGDDLGKYLAAGGMAVNKVASSTMGTLLASGLMSAGKVVRGKEVLEPSDLATMLQAAFEGLQARGKASLGDKTILDAMHPSVEAISQAVQTTETLATAGQKLVDAAKAGRDAVTPLRNRVGRASWVGERTEGSVDPGCEAWVIIASSLADIG
ncbi:MAG: DAK2 domain-containing protein [Deinococcota bacterium]